MQEPVAGRHGIPGQMQLLVTILKAFAKCFDTALSGDPKKLASFNAFWKVAKRFSDDYHQKYGTTPLLSQ